MTDMASLPLLTTARSTSHHADHLGVEVPMLLLVFHGASLGFLDEIEHLELKVGTGRLTPKPNRPGSSGFRRSC